VFTTEIRAAIFDLDGLLIDSEPLWQQAEIEVFSDIGVSLTLEMCRETHGVRVDRVVEYWRSKFPWEDVPNHQVADQIVDRLIVLFSERGEPRPGARQAVELFVERGIPVGIASSSFLRVIESAVQAIGIEEKISVIHSAEFEEHGKPHPAVYLTTAEKMGVDPVHVIAFEDSLVGVEAAVRAGMRCIMVPDQVEPDEAARKACHSILNSLEDFCLEAL
jgi:sugar-phosphatase